MVKVGSSSLTTAERRHRPRAGTPPGRRPGRRRAAAGPSSCWSPPARSPPGWRRSACKRRPRDLARPAGGRRRSARGCWCTATPRSSPGTASWPGRCCSPLDDVTRRSHYRNAHQTFAKLLELGVLPIVNENDTVATTEIRFGDNDRLAALVAHLVHADLLVLLSDVDGLYDADPAAAGQPAGPRGGAERPTSTGSGSASAGGAGSAPAACGPSSRPPGSPPAPASRSCSPRPSRPRRRSPASPSAPVPRHRPAAPTRLLWLAHATEPQGRLLLDAGAVRAVTERRASLLAAGLTGVDRHVRGRRPGGPRRPRRRLGRPRPGQLRRRGAARRWSGSSSAELRRELGAAYEREVVHRDDLVLL